MRSRGVKDDPDDGARMMLRVNLNAGFWWWWVNDDPDDGERMMLKDNFNVGFWWWGRRLFYLISLYPQPSSKWDGNWKCDHAGSNTVPPSGTTPWRDLQVLLAYRPEAQKQTNKQRHIQRDKQKIFRCSWPILQKLNKSGFPTVRKFELYQDYSLNSNKISPSGCYGEQSLRCWMFWYSICPNRI